jgi:hypothetical protein
MEIKFFSSDKKINIKPNKLVLVDKINDLIELYEYENYYLKVIQDILNTNKFYRDLVNKIEFIYKLLSDAKEENIKKSLELSLACGYFLDDGKFFKKETKNIVLLYKKQNFVNLREFLENEEIFSYKRISIYQKIIDLLIFLHQKDILICDFNLDNFKILQDLNNSNDLIVINLEKISIKELKDAKFLESSFILPPETLFKSEYNIYSEIWLSTNLIFYILTGLDAFAFIKLNIMNHNILQKFLYYIDYRIKTWPPVIKQNINISSQFPYFDQSKYDNLTEICKNYFKSSNFKEILFRNFILGYLLFNQRKDLNFIKNELKKDLVNYNLNEVKNLESFEKEIKQREILKKEAEQKGIFHKEILQEERSQEESQQKLVFQEIKNEENKEIAYEIKSNKEIKEEIYNVNLNFQKQDFLQKQDSKVEHENNIKDDILEDVIENVIENVIDSDIRESSKDVLKLNLVNRFQVESNVFYNQEVGDIYEYITTKLKEKNIINTKLVEFIKNIFIFIPLDLDLLSFFKVNLLYSLFSVINNKEDEIKKSINLDDKEFYNLKVVIVNFIQFLSEENLKRVVNLFLKLYKSNPYEKLIYFIYQNLHKDLLNIKLNTSDRTVFLKNINLKLNSFLSVKISEILNDYLENYNKKLKLFLIGLTLILSIINAFLFLINFKLFLIFFAINFFVLILIIYFVLKYIRNVIFERFS